MNISTVLISNPATNSVLVDIIVWLVKISSSVALGVVLFTVLLKLITLPFDFLSRFSMRKNNIKMEAMRPELEKLQRQYADNKDLYNQKMMALYKKNGYSMFGACLPTIFTIVIFFIAIAGFNNNDVVIRDCYISSACSAFRFGGNNILIENCDVFVPCKYQFRGSFSYEEKMKGLKISGKGRNIQMQIWKGISLCFWRRKKRGCQGKYTGNGRKCFCRSYSETGGTVYNYA